MTNSGVAAGAREGNVMTGALVPNMRFLAAR
jgi:hypothetical protein